MALPWTHQNICLAVKSYDIHIVSMVSNDDIDYYVMAISVLDELVTIPLTIIITIIIQQYVKELCI